GPGPGNLAAPRHQHHGTRNQPGIDVFLGCRLYARELTGRQADVFGRRRYGQDRIRPTADGGGNNKESRGAKRANETVHLFLPFYWRQYSCPPGKTQANLSVTSSRGQDRPVEAVAVEIADFRYGWPY